MDSKLSQEISDYISQAEHLRQIKQDLTGKILVVSQTEIAPEVATLLPDGYSIDLPSIFISENTPAGFSVFLRLLYNKNPIRTADISMRHNIYRIQQEVSPKLDELALKYNLDSITMIRELVSP